MRSNLASVIAVSMFSHMSMSGSRVLVPLIALNDGAPPFTIGLLAAPFTLLPMFFSAHLGRLLDRIGLRWPVIVACTATLLGPVLGAMWPVAASLSIVAPLVGSGAMLVYLASAETVGSIGEAAHRARHFSVLALGYSASAFVGPLAAGYALEHFGRTGAFGLLSLFPLLALAIALLTQHYRRGAAAATAKPAPDHCPGIADLLRTPRLLIVLTTSSMVAGGQNLFAFVIPIHATRHGLGAAAVGQMMAAFAIGAFAVRAALPWLASRFSPRVLVATALLVSALAYATLPVTSIALPLLALAALLGAAVGLVQPTIMALLYVVSPPGHLNETSGLNVALNTVAQTAVPLALGVMGGAVGIGMVCWVFAAGLVANATGLRRIGEP